MPPDRIHICVPVPVSRYCQDACCIVDWLCTSVQSNTPQLGALLLGLDVQVVELKEELKKRGLSSTGNKAVLAERLTEAVAAEEEVCINLPARACKQTRKQA